VQPAASPHLAEGEMAGGARWGLPRERT
jgi:hypothetical protein